MFSHDKACVAHGEAYGLRMFVIGWQRREGRSFSASVPPVSALPPADLHPTVVIIAVHNGVWL